MTIRIATIGLCLALIASGASAQQSAPVDGPVSVGVVGGFVPQHHGGGTIGGTVAFAVSERVTLEGRGLFLDLGRNETAVEGTATMLVRLTGERKVMPYAAMGGGVYHSRFDFTDWDRLDMMDEGDWRRMLGNMYAPMMAGPQRIREFIESMPMQMRRRDSTDPAFSFGGGVDIALTPSLYVRPDYRGLMIFADDTHTISSLTFSLGYRF